MAERVLITGGAGFIGLHLARYLLAEGAEVVLLDDFSRGREDDELREVRRDAEVVRHDLTQPLPPGLLRGSFDHVYHLAAVVGVAPGSRDPARVLNVNVRAALHLLDWCRRRLPRTVFLSSTSEVADGAARVGIASFPMREDAPFVLPDPALPRASYALSKIVAETLFRQRADEFGVRIGRYHNIYGPRMGHDHVIPHFIARAVARADPFAIYGADQTRAFCHVSDAVAATVGLTRLRTSAPVLANIGNDREEIRIHELARRVARLADYQPGWDLHPAPAGSPQRRLPDLGTLREAIDYTPRVDLDAGLRATFDWYATHDSAAGGGQRTASR